MKKMHYRYKKRYIFKWDVKKMFKKYLLHIMANIYYFKEKILLLGSKVRESCVSATPDYFLCIHEQIDLDVIFLCF